MREGKGKELKSANETAGEPSLNSTTKSPVE